MKIDIMNVVYTTSMVLLAFVGAIVVTKTIAKYAKKFEDDENNKNKKEID
ncbi:MAG: hypothetical protein QM493_00060 [Sulfurovum sp.]